MSAIGTASMVFDYVMGVSTIISVDIGGLLEFQL